MQTHTAKHFALQLGSLASLYISVGFFLVLVFGLINLLLPDKLDSVWQIESSASMVRFGFAMTIVFFPTYLYLTRTVNKNRRQSSDGTYLGLTKWLIYLSLLVGGAVLLGDLVAIIMGYLEGDLTTRFVLKALAVLAVTGAALFYYLKDAQGYWLQNEKQSVVYGCVAAIVIFATLAVALGHIAAPAEVRERKTDEQQVNDLRDWQSAVDEQLHVGEVLPEQLDSFGNGRMLPQASEGRAPYTYTPTDDGFSLCATFAHTSQSDDRYYPYYDNSQTSPHIVNPDDWYYERGEWCFEREVRF